MKQQSRTCVMGGGSFGTTLANVIAENGGEVRLWLRKEEQAREINSRHRNSRYLPGFQLSENLSAATDMETALEGAELVIVAVPSNGYRSVMQAARDFINPSTMLVSATKGIEAHTFSLMSEILQQELPKNPVGVLSGPNLAKEIASQSITATVIASRNRKLRQHVQRVLSNSYFRVYANPDVYGVELAGALKNIYAIVAGLAAARESGENSRAMLITRGLAEMSRFAVNLGANPMTFLGLAGVGDLIATCTSPLSRNYRVGYALGQGKSLDEAVEELGEVAEGVRTLQVVKERSAELEIYMPMVDGLYDIIFNQTSITEVLSRLMSAEQSSDVDYILPRQ